MLLGGVGPAVPAPGGERLELAWPTPHPGWSAERPAMEFLQHAGNGDPRSGGFGGVRNGGRRFHEGIDIRCLERDRRGEPLDPVMAAMAGVVRHVNAVPGRSSYGRYVVIEHPEARPAVCTLYAHLARTAPGLRAGQRVPRGHVLGVMGHSAGNYVIPKARAHLHFEVALMVTTEFQSWYDRRKFGLPNDHGIWNGMNLMGLDPLALYDGWRAGRIHQVRDLLASSPLAVRVRIATRRAPDLVVRYPSLLQRPRPLGLVEGWEIGFDRTGLPVAWTPLTAAEAKGLPFEQARIVAVDEAILRAERSRQLALRRRGRWQVGSELETVIQLLFGR